jgi:hypothetical protein
MKRFQTLHSISTCAATTWVHSFDLALEAYREMGKFTELHIRDQTNPM